MMHRTQIILCFSILFLFSNCKKDDSFTFSMPYQQSFEIDAGLNTIDTHYFTIADIPTNKTNLFDANSVEDGDVEIVNPGECRLTSVFNAEFGFLFNVSVRMYTDDPAVYKEIFYRDNVPENTGGTLDLIPTLVNVRDFIVEETFNIQIVLERPRVPSPEFIDTIVQFDFKVR